MAALGGTLTLIISVLVGFAMEVGLAGLPRVAWAAGILPLKFSVPQRLFSHFYITGVLWTTLLLVATWAYACNMASLAIEPSIYSNMASHLTEGPFSLNRTGSTSLKHTYMVWNSVFLLLLMEIQVLRRLYEIMYVFNYSPSARMHIFGYLTGIFFYMAAPLSLCCNIALDVYKFSASHVSEFVVGGKNQMPASEVGLWEIASPLLKLRLLQWIGAALLLWGWIHQCRCHAILGSLRKHPEKSDEYVIPHGDWFEIVSSPHYLAEIVIYAGFVVASGGADLTILLLFGFVAANLAFAAAETHRWYHRKFDNYPRNWYVIIRFIY